MGCQSSLPERHVHSKSEGHLSGTVKSTGSYSTCSPQTKKTTTKTTTPTTKMGKLLQQEHDDVRMTVSLHVDEFVSKELPKLDMNGHLLREEVISRTSSSLCSSQILLGNMIRCGKEVYASYAYRSQRGYDPEDPSKSNQDKYGINLSFAGEKNDAMFAVYDGHGTKGSDVAVFAKKKLPQVLAKHIRLKRVQKFKSKLIEEGKSTKVGWAPHQWPFLEINELEDCCRTSFIETNEAMYQEPSLCDDSSGTTVSSVTFHGGQMTVCNLGDSRVILGRRVAAAPTSGDGSVEEEKVDVETELYRESNYWYRDSEAVSLSKMSSSRYLGGIRLEQPEMGETTATTTTDATATTAVEPEIITRTVTQDDEYLVIASNGLFKFLSNDQVIDICTKTSSPADACEELTQAAYDQWLVHEEKTEDITVIVCFLSSYS